MAPSHSTNEILTAWTISHGNLRRFFEETALPPLDDKAQEAAGEAAAEAAVQSAFGLGLDAYSQGVDAVSGAYEAAGAHHVSAPDPDVPQQEGVAAFFDVDNTLIQGASLVMFAIGLAKRRYFKTRDLLPFAWKQIKFRVRGSESKADMAKGREQALEFIKGRDVDELVALCEDIVDENIPGKIWPETSELAAMHLAAGHQVWLVTATPVQLAQIIAKRYGMTGALGTVAEVKDGKFTGRLVGDILHGSGKSHAVAALSTIEDLDLSRCTAYSDSINDIPMLSMVGTAVAINPDVSLRREAKRRGWEVRDYRSIRKLAFRVGLPATIIGLVAALGWSAQAKSHRA